MKAFLIPIDVDKSAYFTESVSVEGETFNLRFLWNSRDEFWYMDVSSVTGTENGIRIVPNSPLISSKSVTNKGNFHLFKSSVDADETEMKYEDFGKKFQLYFVPNEG